LATLPEKLIAEEELLWHIVTSLTAFIAGSGLTVIEKVFGISVQYVVPESKYLGVTLIVVDVGVLLVFKPLNAEIFPVPLAADNPIDVLLLVQENVVFVTVELKLILPVEALLQTMIFEG